MKLNRIAAAGTGLALVAASTLLGATAANAADVQVTLPTIPAETNPYSSGWFAGTVAGGNGTAIQDENGLVITGGAAGYQLLNGTPASGPAGTLADVLSFPQVSSVGDAFYQVSVFGEPEAGDQQFATLRPLIATDLFGDWTVSRSTAGLVAGDPYTPAELIEAFDAGLPAQVLAFGVFVNAGDTVNLRGISDSTDTYRFYTAGPSVVATPGSATVSQAATTPVLLTASGFAPGEVVFFGGDQRNDDGTGGSGLVGDAVADADGVATLEVPAAGESATPGTTTFSATAEDGIFGGSVTYVVTADVVPAAPGAGTPAAPGLPATGIESETALIGAGILFLLGTGFVVFTTRRRAAQG